MNDYILNVIDSLLCYGDGVVTDNPHQRAIDSRLRLEAIAVKNPYGSAQNLAPGQSFSLFANVIATGLTGSSVLSIDPVGPAESVYRLTIDSGPGAFRTSRAVTFADDSSEQGTITTTADFNGSLNELYFLISSPTVNYYAWLNVGGTGLDPQNREIFTGIISGTLSSVSIVAINTGASLIQLVFTGSDTISAAIDAWNIANPSNLITLATGDGSQLPPTQVVTLAIQSALTGLTAIPVAVPLNASNALVAQDIALALTALSAGAVFTATSLANVVSYTDVVPGVTLSPLAPGTSYFTVVTVIPGGGISQKVVVAINNNAIATFTFPGATLTAVQVGDIMRINGLFSYDTAPYAFNPLNAGLWTVVAVAGDVISAIRPLGTSFQAAAEAPLLAINNDVMFYANDVVAPGMMFQITGTFSQVSQRTYSVLNSTPKFIDFVSTQPLPQEDSLTYIPGTIIFYTGVKKLIHIEVDQQCAVQFNGATDTTNQINPMDVGIDNCRRNKGFMTKIGEAYSCTVVNMSINTCRMSFFTVE
jgi:hypothetical protein